jgi:hypothetical protein
MQPRLLAGLLSLVLALHWVALGWLRDQQVDSMHLTRMPQPLFMRVIEATPPAAASIQPRRAEAHDQHLPAGTAHPIPQLIEPALTALPLLPDMPVAEISASEIESVLAGPTRTAVDSDDWPADTRLSYSLSGYYRGNMVGSGQVQWQQSQGHYQVQVDLRMALIVTVSMISQGEVSRAGLLPRAYEERFLGDVQHVTFDGVAVKFHDGSALRQPPALQDTASQFVELSRRFSTGRQALAVGAVVPVWLARPNAMNFWTYDVVALETLHIPEFGDVPAFHLHPRPIANPRGAITADMWFAPSLQYLPVRVRISLGEDNYVDLVVKRIEQGEPQVTGERTLPTLAIQSSWPYG